MAVTWTANNPLKLNLDTAKLAEVAGEVIAKAHRTRIPRGEKGDGSGPQKRAGRGDRDGIRGYRTGVFARSIRARMLRTSKNRSTVSVGPEGLDRGRTEWLARETARGVVYVYPGDENTPLGNEIAAAVSLELDKQIK